MKKIIITIIAILLPLFASATNINGINYRLDLSRKTAEVVQGSYSGNVIIPSQVNYNGVTYTVTSIYYAFFGCSGLTSVTIPNSVTSIGDYAFKNCTGLTSVTIPNSVTSIGLQAFYDCSGLTSVSIPNSVTSIGNYAFSGTPWFNNQPNGLVYAGKVAYKYKGNMPDNTSIIMEDGTVGIADYAFSVCSGLTSVTIPNSVTSIGIGAFIDCSGLTSVTIPNSVTSIGSGAFVNCSGLTSVAIPNSVKSIDSRAFANCRGLTSITIPNSVTSIGSGAFSDTPWFKNQPNGLVYAGKVAYKYKGKMPKNISIIIEDGTVGIAGSAFLDCTSLTSVTIPNSLTSIGISAFNGCRGLTSITIPQSVESIGYCAFSGCISLTSINIPKRVTSIDFETFMGCSGLTSVTIPNSVNYIGGSSFAGCRGLTSVTIPNSVTSIGDYAFSSCSGLTSIKVESGNQIYDSRNNCNAIIEKFTNTLIAGCKNTIIPNNVTSIDNRAFYGCSGLTSITIPNSVISIGYGAFYNCSGLTSVTIPNSVESIGYDAFEDCSGLTSVTIPSSVTSIGYGVFEGCSGLKSIIIGNNVTSIASAFPNCNNIQEAILSQTAYDNGIPTSVTKFTTYSKNPMRVEVVSKGVVSMTMKIYPIDDLGNTNENNFYTVTTSGQTPGKYIKWRLDDENYGIISEKTEGALTMETQPAQPTSTTKARLIATVDEADDDQHYGFEWLRYDAPQEMPANKVSAPLYEGRIIGSLGGLNPDVYYKYRPFYKSDTGEMFYGEWIPFLTGDANVFFEPETHTKEAYGVTATGAQLTGVWIEGTEDIQEKGFEYWTVSGNKTRGVSSDIMTIVVSGNTMTATLEGLKGGTEYGYRSYVKTASGTKYGEDMTFKTPLLGDANNDGVVDVADIIEIVNTKAGHPSASFILNNADMDGDGNLTETDINAIVNIIMQK